MAKVADDDYKARARRRAAERSDSDYYKVKEGDNTFRVLQTPASKKTPKVFFEYNIHRNVGAKRRKLRCGKDMEGEGSCWMCDTLIPKLQKSNKESRAAALEPSTELVIQVAAVNAGKMNGPKLLTPSKGVGNQILTTILGSTKRDYTDHKKGYNVTLNRVGTGLTDTRYGALDRDDDPSEVPESIIAKLKPFSELKQIPIYSEAVQKAVYYNREEEDIEDEDDEDEEEDIEDDDDDEEDDAPPPKKSKAAPPAKKAVKKVVEEDEDEPDDIDDDDDEEDDAPKKGKAAPLVKKKVKVVEEDEEDDDDLDDVDEDEDEAPSPKKGKAAPAKKKKPVEDEDDVDGEDDDVPEDDEDEDDDPPPPARKKKEAPSPAKRHK